MNSNTNNETNTNGMSICIPRAFANITEARVRKVFEKLGIFRIARVDMIQRKNEKGDAYQRIFVHIQDWTETADAQKARERLLAGKELKIVYDDPWFWKASLNTWAPKPKPETTMYDRKPRIRLEFEDKEEEELPYDIRWGDELARRKRQETKKNVESATQLLGSLSLEEDRRPYAERRVDPVYCEQDIKSGFRDRREQRPRDRRPRSPSRSPPRNNRRDDQRDDRRRVSRFSNKDCSRSPDRRDYRDGYSAVIYQTEKPIVIAQALPEPVLKVKEVVVAKALEVKETPAYKMDPEIVRLMCIFHKISKNDVTEELYKNNAQMIRDMRQDEILAEENTKEHKALKVDYTGCAPAPRRKQRQIIAEEVKKDA